MNSDSPSRDQLISFLRRQIKEREVQRDELEKSIHILLEAERELAGEEFPHLSPEQETTEDLPYRIQGHPASREPTPRSETFVPETTSRHKESSSPRAVGSSPGENAELPELPVPPPPEELLPSEKPSGPGRSEHMPTEEESLPVREETSNGPGIGSFLSREPGYSREVEEALQEDQHTLLKMEPGEPSGQAEGGAAPPPISRDGRMRSPLLSQIDLDEELSSPPLSGERPPSPGNASGVPQARPPRSTPLPPGESRSATGHLKDYIRRGGATRCLDPWGQLCAAFVLRSKGPPVFATDAFLNYLRKLQRRLRELHQANQRREEGTAGNSREMEDRKNFACALMGALRDMQFEKVERIAGLRIVGGSRPHGEFEFEKATLRVMHSRVLDYLHELLKKPSGDFFQPEGPDFEIAEYLDQYVELARETGEEKRAAMLLEQIEASKQKDRGIAPNGDAGDAVAGGGKTRRADALAMSTFSASFLEEGKKLQDLEEFDYEPEDKKSILAQKENPFTGYQFVAEEPPTFDLKELQDEFPGNTEDSPPSTVAPEPEEPILFQEEEGPALASGRTQGEEALPFASSEPERETARGKTEDEIKEFLKNFGSDWKK